MSDDVIAIDDRRGDGCEGRSKGRSGDIGDVDEVMRR